MISFKTTIVLVVNVVCLWRLKIYILYHKIFWQHQKKNYIFHELIGFMAHKSYFCCCCVPLFYVRSTHDTSKLYVDRKDKTKTNSKRSTQKKKPTAKYHKEKVEVGTNVMRIWFQNIENLWLEIQAGNQTKFGYIFWNWAMPKNQFLAI